MIVCGLPMTSLNVIARVCGGRINIPLVVDFVVRIGPGG
jgi:hypothetical protein